MSPAHIDLLVDRLCGLFPGSTIARNTIKKAWAQDTFLLKAPERMGRVVLEDVENDKGFPTLGRIKQAFKSHMVDVSVKKNCTICNNTGWDTGETWGVESDTGAWFQLTERYTYEWGGTVYTCVKRCECYAVDL